MNTIKNIAMGTLMVVLTAITFIAICGIDSIYDNYGPLGAIAPFAFVYGVGKLTGIGKYFDDNTADYNDYEL